ncbi:MATE family efflux transporter [Vibrio rotiferianus]|uniref:MATE family efflux transporter n=2 Tax=Vibrio rotiferianus TaxID=190895 RepID=UPI000C3AD0E0|nr:MATE family efflux transporter [Vibrio rotiferianus]PIB18058.1 hypothetical protein B853_00998 [Vibrio rotiferianus CAIM 577 = LMG 21460]
MVNKFYSKIFSSGAVNIVGIMLIALSGIVLARILGVEKYGEYATYMSIVAMAIIPLVNGIPQIVIRELASKEPKENLSSRKYNVIAWSRSFLMFLCVPSALFVLVNSWWQGTSYIMSAILSTIIITKAELFRRGAILTGNGRVIYAQTLVKIIPMILFFLGLAIAVLAFDAKLNEKSTLMIFLSALVASLFFFRVKNKVFLLKNKNKSLYSMWSKSVAPFIFVAAFSLSVNEISIILLGNLYKSSHAAMLSVSIQSVNLITLGMISINSIISPKIAELYSSEQVDKLQDLITKITKISFFISIPIIYVFFFHGEIFLSYVFGYEYRSAEAVLAILTVSQVINLITGPVGLVANMCGLERMSLKISGISFVLFMIFGFILVYFYGPLGFAISIAINVIFSNVVMSKVIYSKIGVKTWLRYK